MSWQQALESLQDRVQQMVENDHQKIGGMTLGSSMRLGLSEVRQAAAMDGSVAEETQTPLGMYGTPTPGEVSSARQHDPVAEAQQQTAASRDFTEESDRGRDRG